MCVLRIIRMGAPWHLRPYSPKPRVAQALQSNFCRVVAHDGIGTQHLEKLSASFCRWLEFRFVREFLHEAVLLFRGAIHEGPAELRMATRVHPVKPQCEASLRLVSHFNGVLGRANVSRSAHRHAIRHHEVDEFSNSCLLA